MTAQPARGRRRRRLDSPPPGTGPEERDVLLGFLDYLRSSIAAKAEGVAEPAVRTPAVSSGTNLLGLVNHLTYVERYLFLGEDVRNWPATFQAAKDDSVEDVLSAYRDAIREANEFITGVSDLRESTRTATRRKAAPSLRWALVHMIEETGRHAGHADVLRELIDGTTGR